jgi:hypothetical protein
MTKRYVKRNISKRKHYNTKIKKNNKITKKVKKVKNIKNIKNIKYGGEPSEEYKQKALFRRTLYNMIRFITNKKNNKNKVKEGINILIKFFNNNKMINTLIPVSSIGKFVDKETGKVPIVDFVSPIIIMLDSFSGITTILDSDVVKILDAYFKNGGNFNSLSSRFKLSPFKNELNKGRIENVKMLLDKRNAFHIYEEGLDEETKTKLAEIMSVEQPIRKLEPEPEPNLVPEIKPEPAIQINQPPIHIKLQLPYPLPNNEIGYNRSTAPEFWKPIFQNGEELLRFREKFLEMVRLDTYGDNNLGKIKICEILETIIPSYFTGYSLGADKISRNINILNCFVTLFYGILLYRLHQTKQEYLFTFKGGRALQLSLVGISDVEKYFSEDTDILIIPNSEEGSKYDQLKMQNLSEHIGYLIKWMIPEEMNIIVSLPTNPKNTNKDLTKILYNNDKLYKALSDIAFEEINQDIRKYFDNLSYSPIYIDRFGTTALFITPTLDDILSEKLFYYAKYFKLKKLLEKNEPINDRKYANLTKGTCDYLLHKFNRAILKLVEAIIKRDYTEVVDFDKKETSRLILRAYIGNFEDYTNQEKEDVVISLFS